jgi:hypothetical protein
MTSYLIVQKDGNIKETSVKQFVENELYKKAGFRTNDGFKLHAMWTVENVKNTTYNIHVYGKTDGRANQENKYEFPPPIDNTLFFGNCIILNKNGEALENLTVSEWELIYDKLYGGFDDINSENECDSEDEFDDVPRTKSGYVKDGFIVDDDEDEEEDDEDDDEDEYEDEDEDDAPKKKKRVVKKKKITKVINTKTLKSPATVFPILEKELDCKNELCEESYIEDN